MGNIREILAKNLRENRQRLNISQPKLAEWANLSTHYVASIETSRKFPTPDVLERLAKALGIESHELFAVTPTPQDELERIRQNIRQDIRQEFRQEILGEVVRTIQQTLSDYKR